MPPLDFPNSPSGGQTLTGPGGIVWTFDGQKWANGVSAASAATPSDALPIMDGTAAPGASALYSRGDHVHPTDTSRYAASNPSGYQTAAQVTTALAPYATLAFVQATVPSLNYANNTGFAINQRTYVSGTALGVGAFGHDRWKGGAGGGTYTFAAPAGPANTITITAGTLQQVVEGAALIGGNYMLSWTGTAQGRVGAGSYAASPVAVTSITAGANTTIEFNAGTLSRVKFESGTVATPWQALDPQQELAKCQRFFFAHPGFSVSGVANAGGWSQNTPVFFPVTMRGTPAMTISVTGGSGYTGGTANTPNQMGFTVSIAPNAATYGANVTFTATADL